MKKFLIWSMGIILFLTATIGLPVIINEAYKSDVGYITVWGAADVLSYYGAILSSFGAILGVFFSIRYAQKNYQEDTRNRSLPMLSINLLGKKTIDPFLEGFDSDDMEQQQTTAKQQNEDSDLEYKRNHWYFSIEKSSVGLSIGVSEILEKKYTELRKYTYIPLRLDTDFYVSNNSTLYIPLSIKNVGNGCALNTTVEFLAADSDIRVFSIPISLSPNDEMHVAIMTSDIKNLPKRYVLSFTYQDIFLNKYIQKNILELAESSSGLAVVQGFTQFPQRPLKFECAPSDKTISRENIIKKL